MLGSVCLRGQAQDQTQYQTQATSPLHRREEIPQRPALIERERLREFFDSLSDLALALDRLQVYQRNGQRREVDLGGQVVLSLDETQPSLLSNPTGTPFAAGRPMRVLGLATERERWWLDSRYERGDGSRRVRLGAGWQLTPDWQAYVDSADLRSELADVPGDPVIGLRRRDQELGLRWLPPAGDGLRLGAEIALRHSALDPSTPTLNAPQGSGTAAVLRGAVDSTHWPGLRLSATWVEPIGSDADLPTELTRGRAEFGAEWRLGPGHPLGLLPVGTRLAWREATRLGLLSDDDALTRQAAYRRHLGIEVPDGSPNGATYAQWRQRSVASDADAQFMLGWRHGWRPDTSTWAYETRIEQAWPAGGPNPLLATQAGLRGWRNDFPRRSVTFDVNGVRSRLAGSAYAGGQITQRLADDWLGALQLSGSQAQPRDEADAGINEVKTAVAVAWREPDQRALHLLTRLSWNGRALGPTYHDPALGDRRSWHWLGHASLLLPPDTTLTLRLARRVEHDHSLGQPARRISQLWLTRWTQDVPGTRWSLSAHLTQRRDDVQGSANGLGAEIGWRLSQRVALALGYNPRGFSDNDLTVDERPARGVSLRLRFTIEGVLGRWLDAGRSDGSASGWQVPERSEADVDAQLALRSPLGLLAGR